jgi:hypothetical protein
MEVERKEKYIIQKFFNPNFYQYQAAARFKPPNLRIRVERPINSATAVPLKAWS